MGNTRTPEQVLRELQGYVDGLIRLFAAYELSDTVKNVILPPLKQSRSRVIELGELLTNDPDNKAVKAEIAKLSSDTTALTRQITKLVAESDSKDEKIKALEQELAELKKPKQDK